MAPLDIDTALEWRGRTVVDRDGDKIGKLEELYLDDSDRPAWGAITTGLFGRRQSFVPLSAMQPDGDDLRVPFEKSRVNDAPNVDPDAQLSDEDEDRLYRHYGVGDAGGSGDGADRRVAARDEDAAVRDEPVAASDAEPAAARAAADEGTERPVERDSGEGAEMIRSEEEVSIGTRRQATHRARLKKYVVTEHVKQVVPVQREADMRAEAADAERSAAERHAARAREVDPDS